jgi:hypothetical protein
MKTPRIFQVRSTVPVRLDAPQCLEASALKTFRCQSNTVRTLGQASLISTRSWISVDTIWEVSARCSDSMATRERSDSEDCPDARPSCLDVVQLWEESHYSGKAVAKDRPDEANFCLDANSLEFNFEQN